MLEAVNFLHQNNIAHTDLKPENIVTVTSKKIEYRRKIEKNESKAQSFISAYLFHIVGSFIICVLIAARALYETPYVKTFKSICNGIECEQKTREKVNFLKIYFKKLKVYYNKEA